MPDVGPTIAYLILAHRDPDQVVRLVNAVREGEAPATVVVHFNETVGHLDPALFAGLDDVHVVPWHQPVQWGDWSLAERLLHALRWTVAAVDCDWVVLLSGQDYPLLSIPEIEADLASTRYDAIFDHELVDPQRGHTDSSRRYYFRHARLPAPPRVPSTAPAAVSRAAQAAGRRVDRWNGKLFRLIERSQGVLAIRRMPRGVPGRVGVRKRRTPFGPGLRCYKGNVWMTVRRDALARALTRLDASPALVAYYRRTLIPEESLIPTLLLNDPDTSVENRSLRFELFDRLNRGSPTVLNVGHLPEMLGSGRHFARKFDGAVDAEVLERLDALRRCNPTRATRADA